MITEFNKPNLKTLRGDLEAALSIVAEKHGIRLDLGNIRFSAQDFRVTLNAAVIPDASTASAAPTTGDGAIDLVTVAYGNVLPANLQGRQFRVGGKLFTLVGVKSSRHKYPFSAVGPQGGRYKFTIDQVQRGLI